MLPIQGAPKILRMTPQMDIDDDEDLDDKYDLCVSAASRSDVISRSGRLFAPPGKAADAVSNKYPIKICLQFILTCCTAPYCLEITN